MGNTKIYDYFASYDKRAGMIQKKTRPSGTFATYDYNNNNEESRITYRNPASGASLDFALLTDAEGKVATIDSTGGISSRFNYNHDGQLYSANHSIIAATGDWSLMNAHVSFVYDDEQRTTVISNQDGREGFPYNIEYNSIYSYDSMSNVSYVGTGKCTYDGSPCLDGVETVWASASFIYDDKNQVAATSRGDASISYFDRDIEGNLTSSYTGRNATMLVKENASYDALSNLTRHAYTYKSASSTDTARLNTYTYDAVNRLTTADVNGAIYGYTYDNFGNLTQKKKGASTDSFRYNQGDQLASYDISGVTYNASYDPDGNMLTDGLDQYAWNLMGKIASVTTSADTTSYEYQHDGLRHSKKIGTSPKIMFTYDQNNELIAEHTVSADLTAKYTWAGGKVISYTKYAASTDTFATYYLHADAIGNIVSVTDKNGAVVKTYEYDPYGNVVSSTGTLDQPFQYKGAFGYYTDKETGLIYLQQRYYSPKLMRFLSQDPLNCNCEGEIMSKLMQPLDLNPYVYVIGNPVMLVDPSGEVLQVVAVFGVVSAITLLLRVASAIYAIYQAPSVWRAWKSCQSAFNKWFARTKLDHYGYKPIMNDEGIEVYPAAAHNAMRLPEFSPMISKCLDALGPTLLVSVAGTSPFWYASAGAAIRKLQSAI